MAPLPEREQDRSLLSGIGAKIDSKAIDIEILDIKMWIAIESIFAPQPGRRDLSSSLSGRGVGGDISNFYEALKASKVFEPLGDKEEKKYLLSRRRHKIN